MKTFEELHERDVWPEIQRWIGTAKNPVEILPGERERGEQALLTVQITSASPLGSIALNAGGLLFDHGWMRFLGSGHPKIAGSLVSWNHKPHGAVFVGYDVVGGCFAIDLGALGLPLGNVAYFSPDTLAWEDLKSGYPQVLAWALSGDTAKFYEGLRWPGWEREVAEIPGDHGIWVDPPPSMPGPPLAERQRKPMKFGMLWMAQLGLAKKARQG